MNTLVHSADFFTSAPDRIIGTETEYDVQAFKRGSTFAEDRPISLVGNTPVAFFGQEVLERVGLDHGVYATGKQLWLPDGSVLYFDGETAELSTREETGPLRAALAEASGARIVQLLGAAMIKYCPDTKLRILRHAGMYVGDRLATLGPHGNYATARSLCSRLASRLISTHMATRPIYSGGGLIGPNGPLLSQKALDIGLVMNTSHPNYQPTEPGKKSMGMFHAVDDEVNGAPDLMRVEDRCRDALILPRPNFLEKAAMSLVLRILEHPQIIGGNHAIEDILLRRPVPTLHAVTRDLGMRRVYECVDGKRRSAANIQEILAEFASRIVSEVAVPDDEESAAPLWRSTVDAVRRCKLPKNEYSDALIRTQWGEHFNYLEQTLGVPAMELTSRNPDHVAATLAWSNLVPRGGAIRLANSDETLIQQAEVRAGMWKPIGQTRAQVRSKVLADIFPKEGTRGKIYGMEWSNIQGSRPDGTLLDLYLHPYQTTCH